MKAIEAIQKTADQISDLDKQLNDMYEESNHITTREREVVHEFNRLENDRTEGGKLRRRVLQDEFNDVKNKAAEIANRIRETEGLLHTAKRKIDEERAGYIEALEEKLKVSRQFASVKDELSNLMELWIALYGGRFNDETWLSELFDFDTEKAFNSTKAKRSLLIG